MKTILLLGSGELGKEFAIAAQRLGQTVVACDKYAGAPAMQVADAGDPRTDIRIFGKPSARVNRRMGVVVGYEPHGSSLEALRERVCAAAAKVKVTE